MLNICTPIKSQDDKVGQLILILKPSYAFLLAGLKNTLKEETGIKVLVDRRSKERRQGKEIFTPERRKKDRRSNLEIIGSAVIS